MGGDAVAGGGEGVALLEADADADNIGGVGLDEDGGFAAVGADVGLGVGRSGEEQGGGGEDLEAEGLHGVADAPVIGRRELQARGAQCTWC